MKVAIIGGSGKMGRWFARFLVAEGREVVITGRDQKKLRDAGRELGVAVATNAGAVKGADVVLLSVPLDGFAGVVEELSPHIRDGQIVIDITSVKRLPVEVMHEHIKAGVVLGVHPLFGPGATGIARHNFVLTPTSDAEGALAQKVQDYLEARGARVTLMAPDEHDEVMSLVLGLSHFIALVAADTLLSRDRLGEMEAVGGASYRVLLALVKSVLGEDPELYASLQMSLPHVAQTEALFQKKAGEWAELVKNGDRQRFVEKMSHLRDRLMAESPDFEKAYQNVYRLAEQL